MRAGWLSSLGLALGACAASAATAQEVVWRPARAGPIASSQKHEPAVTLEAPVPIAGGAWAPVAPAAPVAPVATVGYTEAPRPVVRAQMGDGNPIPPPAPPPGVAPFAGPPGGLPPDPYLNGGVPEAPAGTGFWDKCKNVFNLQTGPLCGEGQRKPFQSDHAFDGFISPVSNPFFFEDPRSLTEVRPVFIWQSIPHKNFAYEGGHVNFFGVDASVALTERLSVVVSKLGWLWLHPGNTPFSEFEGNHTEFANVNIGPQYTFLRNDRGGHNGTLGAVGLLFEVPTGNSRIGEADGLSLFPYLTMAQNFGCTSYGSFNAVGEIGYSAGVDNKPSDYFMASLHLDYDVGNLHKIYPLIELNWRHYTSNGRANDVNFEGGDLINFGATNVSGRNELTLAPGLRYKFTEAAQIGTAFEFPLVGTKDLNAFRWTLDFILKY